MRLTTAVKEILIIMHCPVKGQKVARFVSMNMFSIPDYNADEGWECNMITRDEGKRVELIKQWIDERANEQHESSLEFVKYEIVEEGAFAERDLNRQFKLEAEKQNCEPVAEVAAEAVLEIEEPEAAEAAQVESKKPEEAKTSLTIESAMTIDSVDEGLLEANGVWGGEFRGQWKYKILYRSVKFFHSMDKELSLGHAVAAYNSIPVADRVGTKEEAYGKINKVRYERLDVTWGRRSMNELSDMMRDCKALSSSLFSGALKGMEAMPFSVSRNRSVRNRLSVGYVGETIADLAFYVEERAKIEAMAE